MDRKLIGRYIVADPKICHGKPTIRGTRILVADVLTMVASGRDWYSITEAWGGKVPREAIAEAVGLANQAFFEHLEDYVVENSSMNVLDENIADEQRDLLKSWHVRVHHIGFDIGRAGMQDEEIIPLLLRLRRPTFFTRDLDFYKRGLCHARYSIVYRAIEPVEVAAFACRLLRHPELDTEAKRMGTLIRVAYVNLTIWRLHAQEEERSEWVG